MRSASYQSSAYYGSATARERAINAALAVLLVLLLIFALMRLGALPDMPGGGDGRPLTFEFLPSGGEQAPAKRATVKTKPAAKAEAQRPPATAPVPPLPTPLRSPAKLGPLEGIMNLSREDFAKTDVDRMRSRGAEVANADSDAGGGVGGPSSAAVGTGPNGQTLYAAEWYREPSRSQTAPYMPANVAKGWGIIACRTIDRYHVDDCRELGESPGSGIARGLRQAAWQFLVRPPRINGKPQIGTWVRIRFDIVEGATD